MVLHTWVLALPIRRSMLPVSMLLEKEYRTRRGRFFMFEMAAGYSHGQRGPWDESKESK